MPARGRAVALAVLACVCVAALGLSACDAASTLTGGDDSGTKHGKAAAAVVKKFALATGPRACDLLTPNALRNVYGGYQANGTAPALIDGPPPQYALDHCRVASRKFQGQKVDIDKVDLLSDQVVKVQASVGSGSSGRRLYDVTVRSKGATWLIDEIREK